MRIFYPNYWPWVPSLDQPVPRLYFLGQIWLVSISYICHDFGRKSDSDIPMKAAEANGTTYFRGTPPRRVSQRWASTWICDRLALLFTHVLGLDMTEIGDGSEVLPGGTYDFTLEHHHAGVNLDWIPRSVLLPLEVIPTRRLLISSLISLCRHCIPLFSRINCHTLTQIHLENGLNMTLYPLPCSLPPLCNHNQPNEGQQHHPYLE